MNSKKDKHFSKIKNYHYNYRIDTSIPILLLTVKAAVARMNIKILLNKKKV